MSRAALRPTIQAILSLLRRWSVVMLLPVLALCACAPMKLPRATGGDLRTASDQSDPERRARVRLELASAYFSQGQLETALDELKQALVIFPDLPEGHNLRGLIYAGLGQPHLADEGFERALVLAPNDPNILHNHGWYLCQRGRHPQAQQAFDRALAQPLMRDPSKTLLAKGVCLSMAGQPEEAVRVLGAAYERDPGNPALATNLAEILFRRGQVERAAFYIRRVNQQPAWVTAQTLWLGARIERRLGQQEAAGQWLQQLRSRFPTSPEALAADRGVFDE